MTILTLACKLVKVTATDSIGLCICASSFILIAPQAFIILWQFQAKYNLNTL